MKRTHLPVDTVIEYTYFSSNQREAHQLAARIRMFELELRYKVNAIVREQRNLHTAFEVSLIRTRMVGTPY